MSVTTSSRRKIECIINRQLGRRLKKLTFIILVFTLVFGGVASAQAESAYSKTSKRWRPEVRRCLKEHHVWSKRAENKIISIISKESGGSQTANNGHGCVGLLQFDGGWRHNYSKAYFKKHHIKGKYRKDNRLNGYWSIHRIVKAYKDGGYANLRRHWVTY